MTAFLAGKGGESVVPYPAGFAENMPEKTALIFNVMSYRYGRHGGERPLQGPGAFEKMRIRIRRFPMHGGRFARGDGGQH